MTKKPANVVIDSRHLKILSAKKEQLRDSVVFIWLNEKKFGVVDKAHLNKIVAQIDKIEPNGVYFPFVKDIRFHIYDKSEFKNKEILVTIHSNEKRSKSKQEIEDQFRKLLPMAKSISFIHNDATIEEP